MDFLLCMFVLRIMVAKVIIIFDTE
jgi:hypothetical protein